MKKIKYNLVQPQCGETEGAMHQKEIICADEHFDTNYAIAQKEAYNGEITVEEVTENAEDT